MEVYIDDMVVNSRTDLEHPSDLKETFDILQEYDVKLNPKKHVFEVRLGKFLGFMISHHGIEANPDKVRANLDMHPPRNIKELQHLMGCVFALGHFMSRSTERCHTFFHMLKRRDNFKWTSVTNQDFQELKEYLSRLLKIVSMASSESLVIYLTMCATSVAHLWGSSLPIL